METQNIDSWGDMHRHVVHDRLCNPGQAPPFILCGHINLHKSPACAAQFVVYINHAMENYAVNSTGAPVFMYPKPVRGNRPITVSQWRERRSQPVTSTVDAGDNLAPDREDLSAFRRELNRYLQQARKRTGDKQNSAGPGRAEGSKPEAFLFAVQEPCIAFGKIVNVRGATVIFDMGAKEPRAALVMSTTLNAWPVPELSNGDLAVAMVKLKNGLSLYVASYYADRNKTAISQKVKTLINRAEREGHQLLLMSDTNSHSEALWNGKSTCDRGKAWEEYLANKSLQIHNVGDTFTFNTERGQTIIDVTFSTAEVGKYVNAWVVADRVPASDHLSVEFQLQLECTTAPPRYIWSRCKWEDYTKDMETKP